MRISDNSLFRRLAILLAFASALASCRVAYNPYMTSRLGTTEYYRWDIKSLDTVSIYNLRILDKGAFKMEESHCFANHYPVSWFLAQNVANKGLSLKDVEKDERSRFPKMKGKRLRLPPYPVYRPPMAGSLRHRCIHRFHKGHRYRFRMDALPLRCRKGTYGSVYVLV